MIKEGDKYIIEIDHVYEGRMTRQIPNLYRVKGMKTLLLDKYGLNMLQKYDPDVEYQKGRQISKAEREQIFNHGMDKAWEMAKEIRLMPIETRIELFNGYYDYQTIMNKYTPQEVKEILDSRNLEDEKNKFCQFIGEECPYSIECSQCEVASAIEKAKAWSRVDK